MFQHISKQNVVKLLSLIIVIPSFFIQIGTNPIISKRSGLPEWLFIQFHNADFCRKLLFHIFCHVTRSTAAFQHRTARSNAAENLSVRTIFIQFIYFCRVFTAHAIAPTLFKYRSSGAFQSRSRFDQSFSCDSSPVTPRRTVPDFAAIHIFEFRFSCRNEAALPFFCC